MKKKPEILKINYEELEQLIQRVKNELSEEDAKIIEGMVDMQKYIGIKSEKSKNVIKNEIKNGTP